MNIQFHDPIVAEVRKTREDLLAEFDGDMNKLHQYLAKQQPVWEAAGFRYVTEEERQTRLAWRRKQDEDLALKILAL
jgi:hypothetical protein